MPSSPPRSASPRTPPQLRHSHLSPPVSASAPRTLAIAPSRTLQLASHPVSLTTRCSLDTASPAPAPTDLLPPPPHTPPTPPAESPGRTTRPAADDDGSTPTAGGSLPAHTTTLASAVLAPGRILAAGLL